MSTLPSPGQQPPSQQPPSQQPPSQQPPSQQTTDGSPLTAPRRVAYPHATSPRRTYRRRAASPGSDSNAAALQRRMAKLRQDMRHEAAEVTYHVSQRARQAVDWKFYVGRYPLASAGVALLVGYLLVPNKKHILQPTNEQLSEMACQGKLKIKAAATPSLRYSLPQKALLALGSIATKAVMGYLGREFRKEPGPLVSAADTQ